MAAALGDDDFDQFDKPGSERSRRRKTSDDDSGSDLDDLLEEDLLSGNKNQSDYSDEDLNDDLLQSDEEEQEQQQSFSSEVVTVSLNATSGMTASFELSKSTNDQSPTPDPELDDGEDEVVYEESEEPEEYAEEYTEVHYEGTDAAELTEELMEYAEDQEEEEIDTDEALVLEINEPLDEFPDDELAQTYTGLQEYVAEEELEEDANSQVAVADSEELGLHTIKTEEEKKDESDEEEEDDERSGRIRFITERKEGTIIRLSEAARERRNIPETLELSVEDKAALMEFEEQQRHRKYNRFGGKRGGHARRGGAAQFRAVGGDQRKDNNESKRTRDNRHPFLSSQPSVAQPIRSLFQQQAIQPLLPMTRPRHLSPLHPKTESPRVNKTNSTPSQPKNIHINPHFKGSVVTPVQVPLLPTPPQPRPAAVPQRFPGPPDFPPHAPPHITGNLNQGPRIPPPDHWRSPPPVQERDQFFIGDPRFPNHHVFDQRNPPPPHPPPLLNSNHSMPSQGPLSFSQSAPGFNSPGQQSGFNLQSQQPNFSPQGQPPGYNLQGQQSSYSQHGQPPRFNHQGQPPLFNQQGHQSGFTQPGQQPGFNQQGQQLSFAQGQQSGFNQIQPPGFNPLGQPCGFNQQGQQSGGNQHGQQSGYNQHGPQSEFNQQGQQSGYNQQGPQSGFPRDRTVRPSIQSPGGSLLHYNQPAAGSTRPFIAPRQQFPPSPGQPFISHAQSNMQGLLHHPPPPTPPHHHLPGPPQPLLPISLSPFRPHLQAAQQQQNSTRMQFPQRQGHIKPRHSTPTQNAGKRNQPLSLPRNSNLRELPIAPSHASETTSNRRGSVPAAQVKPISHATSTSGRTALGVKKLQGKVAKQVQPAEHPKTIIKPEEKLTDEDEETKLYRLKIEEQKRLREEILKQKELRRQQQAGARKKELLQRLAQQYSPSPQLLSQQETQSPHMPVNCNSAVPQTTVPVRQNVKNRLLVQKQEALGTNVPQKTTHFQQGAGTNIQFQGQQIKAVKQIRTNRLAPQNPVQPVQKMVQAQPTPPVAVTTPAQTAKVALVQGRSQDVKAGVKRTVMQRANSGSGDGPHIAAKVRVIKLSGAQGGENAGFTYLEGQPQRVPQSQPQQQRAQPVRKVTLTKATVPQQTHIQAAIPQGVRSIQGIHQPKQVLMRGRGRGTASQMGRGRMMPNTKNLRVVECKPQPCTVSVEGLSSSTTDFQLQSLLMSVGPIESCRRLQKK